MLYSTSERVSSELLPYGEVKGDWSDRDVYVIGAGPSLEGFNFGVLDGYTIGANRSAVVAKTDAMFSLDWKYCVEAHEEILEYPGEIYMAIMTKHETKFNPRVTYLKAHREGSMSTNPAEVIGLNSGYGAVNIAILKGAKKINLLGLDMKLGAKKHFHGGYEWDRSKGASYNAWARRFKNAKDKIDELGVEITNYIGPNGSGLDVYFKSKSLKELDPDYPQ